jgi:hypothetical protein
MPIGHIVIFALEEYFKKEGKGSEKENEVI